MPERGPVSLRAAFAAEPPLRAAFDRLRAIPPGGGDQAAAAGGAGGRPTGGIVRVTGAPAGSWGFLAQALLDALERPLLVVSADAEAVADEVNLLDGVPPPLAYPAADVLPMDREPPSDEVVGARLEAQAEILTAASPRLVVASPAALMRVTPPPDAFRDGVRRVRRGQRLSQAELVAWLVAWGYRREAQLDGRGQFAVRGGIVDVFPPSAPGPLRIELFGDEVESIRGFDVASQASIARREEALLLPAREFPHRAEDAPQALARLAALDLSKCLPEVAESWREDIARLGEAGYFSGIESLYPYLAASPSSLLDYFAEPPLVLLLEPERVRNQADRHLAYVEELLRSEGEHGEMPLGLSSGLVPWAALLARFGPTLEVERVGTEGSLDLGWPQPPSGAGRIEEVAADLRHRLGAGQRVLLASQQERRAIHLLEAERLPASELEELDFGATALGAGVASVVDGSLRGGFTLPASDLTVLTDLELFGVPAAPSRRRRRGGQGGATDAAAAFRLEVAPGSLVVHQDHGIGIFQGLRSIDDGGMEREYIHIEYAGGDRVFVPVEHMDRIQLYIGGGVGEGTDAPRLSKLGTGDWDRTKRRVRKAVEEMAEELILIYARREVADGYAFSPDGPWQAELEASFPYQETPDQLRAVEEIKADMEAPRAMDRLLVGDVGFGKTEVALRAAFKAAVDGKQVAILVPTTVLANQHWLTFRERLQRYPIRVEMLSRFVDDEAAAQIRAGIAAGTVDIVIGTHRLLSGQVRFKDLGLLVIDEEQRFGVAQKERLKKLRATLDVLSMSATPIPRTLHMSLGGIRDLSVLATPPEERQPVRTFVTADADNLIREVVLRELDRGGQTFFVHNRVRGIQAAADRVRRLVPEARVVVAHGQMDEHQLHQVMLHFIQHEYDVLVCTTIIESGIDIPAANLILVQDSDRFGLADLYQLRGRVGRSGARAYAYFLYDPARSVTENADKRLDVIGEYQELGAGFKLALKDLEIRGAGNLLGAEQSGEIAAVGFEMYNQMLRDAVGRLRGGEGAPVEEPPPAVAPLELPLDHYLPRGYVPDEKVRMQVYAELAAATTEAQLGVLGRRLKDRFGAVPGPVENLLYSLRVKILAQAAGAQAVTLDGDHIVVRFPDARAGDLAAAIPSHRLAEVRRNKLRFAWRRAGDSWREALAQLLGQLGPERAAA
ncbi:MAG TPA: transcription-repair coupling factor [Candidatus Dormibacteraeota bacterium]|jgi:transcription-repair coupling factor (superfamily II helicase)|nr:transcription-repair coupling factor [Candidatus Dormibacteraeota bacterium]